MYARKELDADTSELLHGVRLTMRTGEDEQPYRERLERLWLAARPSLACLSVRSGFDLLLQSVDWEPGSEVLMSAVTIPHMERLVREHGYVPVPVDLDLATMWPMAEAMERGLSERTRAVVVAHLFGSVGPVGPIADFCERHGLLLVEDRAQAFDGVRLSGHPRADVSMFSFGTIKTATAMGGAIIQSCREDLLEKMRRRQEAYPVQPTSEYVGKLLKGAAMTGLTRPAAYGLFTHVVEGLGLDREALLRRMSRGFPEEGLLTRIRRRPCAGLLAFLRRRLIDYDASRVEARAEAGRTLARMFSKRADPRRHFLLGGDASLHTHWIFPVVSHDPEAVIRASLAAGFDTTAAASTLIAVGAASQAPRASAAMQQVVYLPLSPRMTGDALGRLADAVLRIPAPTAVRPRSHPAGTIPATPRHSEAA